MLLVRQTSSVFLLLASASRRMRMICSVVRRVFFTMILLCRKTTSFAMDYITGSQPLKSVGYDKLISIEISNDPGWGDFATEHRAAVDEVRHQLGSA